jgi:ParB family transcriptional regulator, chromosome partitioning protein
MAWASGPKPMFVLPFWLSIMPAVRCVQGHGLRFATGEGSHSCRCAGTCAPGPCAPRPYAGPNLNCQKANRTGGHTDAWLTQKGSTMTDTANTEIAANGTEQPTGTLEHLDPTLLDIADNVRDDAALSKAFVASIAENGVLVPITGVRDPENPALVRVRNGQRRTLAAREVGLPSVPVYVLPSIAADASQETIDRIVHQIVTNDQKQDLTDAQRARGIQQMIDAGMWVTKVAKVAKRLSVAKVAVKAAHTAASSSAAMDALASGQLSLVEAAAITEFEDMPGALDRLLSSAGTRRFEHTVAQLRQERASAEAEAQAAQVYTDQGFTVLEQRPESWDQACIPLRHLVTAEADEADDNAVSNPAHWAVLLYEDTALCDVETGEVVDEEAVDWDTEDQPDAEPAEGLRHAKTVTETTVFAPEYYCLDYRAAGLAAQSWFARQAGMVDTDTGEAVDLDDDAREAARQQAATERAEAEKRERRKVLALNKLGDAALSVRREFVKKLLARRLPRGLPCSSLTAWLVTVSCSPITTRWTRLLNCSKWTAARPWPNWWPICPPTATGAPR